MFCIKKFFLSGILLATLFACARPPLTVIRPEDALEQVSSRKHVNLDDDMEFRDIAASVRQSLEYYKKLSAETSFVLGPDRVTALDMSVTLQNFLLIIENDSLTHDQKAERIKKGFVLYRSVGSNGNGKVLFTGYYEPLLSCRVTADETYRYPLYRKPDDII